MHTPEPWASVVPPSFCLTRRFIEGPDDEHIAKIGHEDWTSGSQATDLANADRIVACVNACAGINPKAIPALVALARYILLEVNGHNATLRATDRTYAASKVCSELTDAVRRARIALDEANYRNA